MKNEYFVSKQKAAGGRESKACEEMERRDESTRSKEAQMSTNIETFVSNLRGATAKVHESMF